MITKNLVSLIIGLICGHLIIKYIYPQSYLHGPNSNEIRQDIHFDNLNQECYQFIPQPYVCPLALLKSK